MNELDNFKVGDLVTITFALNGRPFDKDGKTTYFTSVNGYKIEPYQRPNGSYQQPNESGVNSSNPPSTQQPTNGQKEQPFPPQVDDDGNTNNDDNLPF